MFETIRLQARGETAELVLARPERLNAIGKLMMGEIGEACSWLDQHPELRVVVLSGEGRAFSAGADLKDSSTADAAPAAAAPWQVRRAVGQRGLRMINAVEGLRAVTVARLHGHVVGGGLLLACACDLRLAAEGTAFSIPEVELGIPLAWGGIPRLVREIGPAMTRELVMTCRRFDAAEAKQLGLLNRVVPDADLDHEVEVLVARLLAMPAAPLAMTKDQVNAAGEAMLAARVATADGDLLLGALADPEGAAARQRYVERTLRKRK
jgi:enoyl-CoA hydratase/3-hydroxypropionyl-coenzyme A dehydratase